MSESALIDAPRLPGRGTTLPCPGEALLIRRWAREVLGSGSGPGEQAWRLATACDPASWRLFLSAEGCALPLGLRLRQSGAWDRLPEPVAAQIRMRAQPELQRSISARAHLVTLGRIAAERGWRMIVLKGGAAVARGAQLDLVDLDILVDRAEAREVALALEDAGFAAMGTDRSTSRHHHLVARMQPNALPIEIHHSLSRIADVDAMRDRAVPLAGHPRLWCLAPADHLRYLLVHITAQHPERAGRIRDLLVIAAALEEASPADIAAVEAELADHEDAATIREVIRQANALRARAWDDDPFEHRVLCHYIVVSRTARGAQSSLQEHLIQRALHYAVSTRSRWRDYREYQAKTAATIDATPVGDWLRRHLSPLATAIQYLIRIPLFLAALVTASGITREAREIEKLLQEDPAA